MVFLIQTKNISSKDFSLHRIDRNASKIVNACEIYNLQFIKEMCQAQAQHRIWIDSHAHTCIIFISYIYFWSLITVRLFGFKEQIYMVGKMKRSHQDIRLLFRRFDTIQHKYDG